MKRLKFFSLIISIYLLALSCEANKESENKPLQPEDKDVRAEKAPSMQSKLRDSLGIDKASEHWMLWEEYLFLYSESDSLSHLDSANVHIASYLKMNDFPLQYITVGTTYELVDCLDIANHYYKEGKAKVAVWKKKPELSGQPDDYLNLMNLWFSLLLNSPVDSEQLIKLEEACNKDPMGLMYGVGPRTRDALFDQYSL